MTHRRLIGGGWRPPPGVVGWWPLRTDLLDYSGHNQHLTALGTAVISGGSLLMDGANNSGAVALAPPALRNIPAVTVAIWARPTAVPSGRLFGYYTLGGYGSMYTSNTWGISLDDSRSTVAVERWWGWRRGPVLRSYGRPISFGWELIVTRATLQSPWALGVSVVGTSVSTAEGTVDDMSYNQNEAQNFHVGRGFGSTVPSPVSFLGRIGEIIVWDRWLADAELIGTYNARRKNYV